MNYFKAGIVVAVGIMAVGVCGLLNNLDVLPGVGWFPPGGLAVAGGLLFLLTGVNKLSFVLGPFLLVGAVLSVLHQLGRVETSIVLPLLLILFGLLLLLSFVLHLKMPEALQIADEDNPGRIDRRR